MRFALCSVLVALVASPTLARQPALLPDPGLEPGDWFGRSVAIHGDIAVVGAFGDDDDGENMGAAYVYRHDGTDWALEQKLVPSGGRGGVCGASVDTDGTWVAVGCPGTASGAGAVFVYAFDGSTWQETDFLTAADGEALDQFGFSVSVDGEALMVGATRDDDKGNEAGAVYFFRRGATSWVPGQKLTASNGRTLDFFGRSVSVSGDLALVGASSTDRNGNNSGSVYVFQKDAALWIQVEELTASDAAALSYFGHDVSLSGTVAVIGAREDSDLADRTGSAYVFRIYGNSWIEEQELHASDAETVDFFGDSVAIDGDVLVVGAHPDDYDGMIDVGSAYVFRYDGSTWSETAHVKADDATARDFFGYSVDISGSRVAIGATQAGYTGSTIGKAYVFDADAGVAVEPGSQPSGFRLSQNYPNPFNPGTTVSFELPTAERVNLELTDPTGRVVRRMTLGEMPAGVHASAIYADGLPSGVYFCTLTAGRFRDTLKMVLLK